MKFSSQATSSLKIFKFKKLFEPSGCWFHNFKRYSVFINCFKKEEKKSIKFKKGKDYKNILPHGYKIFKQQFSSGK
jgi:hypothetical protein